MAFVSIGIKTSIPVTVPSATSGAVTFTSIDEENWLQISGDASAGSGSLYLLRWYPDLAEWRVYMEDKPMSVNSATFSGQFSGHYPFPSREESFVLYDPASAITATASAARTGSPLAAPTPASSGASGGATEAKQDTGNASLVSILGQLDSKTSTLATASAQTTGNSSLSSIDGKVATAAKQDTGNTSLSSIDSKVATAANQTTANSSLASILAQLDSKTSALATASAQTTGNTSLATIATQQTDGTQKTQVTSSALPTGAATAAKQPALGTAGTPSADVLSVQGVVGGTPQPVSGPLTDAQLRASSVPVSQGAGSGAAGTFWYTRNTDGTNTQPTMDTAARSGYQRITDGTNTATVKAASTAPTASDTALVATLSPNSRPGGGSSFTWFSTATGSLLKTGAGVVRRIIVGSNVAGTVTLHDNTSAAGTVITSVTSTTSTPCNQVELGVAFSTGLYCTTTGSGISVTVVYD